MLSLCGSEEFIFHLQEIGQALLPLPESQPALATATPAAATATAAPTEAGPAADAAAAAATATAAPTTEATPLSPYTTVSVNLISDSIFHE